MTVSSVTTDLVAFNFNLETSGFSSLLHRPPPLTGQSFMHELAREGDVLSAEVIMNAGGKLDHPDEDGRRPLHEAAFFGRLDMVDFLLRNGAMIDVPVYPFGHTALYLAVMQGHVAVVRLLLERGAYLGVDDSITGQGLLHLAAESGNMELAGILISAGVNIFHEDEKGRTARDIAAQRKHRQLESVLLKVMEHHARTGV